MGDTPLSTPAGWYDDGSGQHRWFDGENWTDRYLKDHQPSPPAHGTGYHPKMDAAAPGGLQPKKNGNALLWGCVGCVVVPVLFVAGITIIGMMNGGSTPDTGTRYEAIRYCEDRVKTLLKSPSTAEFNSSATGSGTWKVTGTVDSENSFGAMIRSDFACTVKIAGDSFTASVDYLE